MIKAIDIVSAVVFAVLVGVCFFLWLYGTPDQLSGEGDWSEAEAAAARFAAE